jgi:hypothetical protein
MPGLRLSLAPQQHVQAFVHEATTHVGELDQASAQRLVTRPDQA